MKTQLSLPAIPSIESVVDDYLQFMISVRGR